MFRITSIIVFYFTKKTSDDYETSDAKPFVETLLNYETEKPMKKRNEFTLFI
jgi:hypothetical protein